MCAACRWACHQKVVRNDTQAHSRLRQNGSPMMAFSRAIMSALALWAASAFAEPPIEARERLNAVLWLQAATEYRAAAMQTYRSALRELLDLRSDAGTACVEQA